MKTSRYPGFYRMSIKDRLKIIKKHAKLSRKEMRQLKKYACLDEKTANRMIENVIGTIQLPLGVAANFRINHKDYLIPMALEEPSVVAAASHAAKLARPEGFSADADEPLMIGQIQLGGLPEKYLERAKKKVLANKRKIAAIANNKDSVMVGLGGGFRDIEVRKIKTNAGSMLIVHLIIDVRDAMGANCVNTMAESVSPFLENLTGGRATLRIISNLATNRLARATAIWKKKMLGEELINRILEAYAFAEADPYRCATHNKGIMNAVDAVVISTGNDFRAIEAGAHAFAAINMYKPLTKYWKDRDGNLVGSIELPVAVGTVGGATRTNPIAQISLKILGVSGAQELAQVIASVGLASNFAALRAMAKEGIQRGHMKLHASNIAAIAGAKGYQIDRVSRALVEQGKISVNAAKDVLDNMKRERRRKIITRLIKKERRIKRKIFRRRK